MALCQTHARLRFDRLTNVDMERYFHPWTAREQAYYSILRSEGMRKLLPWNEWSFALASLVQSLFPFSLLREGDTAVQVGANRNSLGIPGCSQPMLLAACVGRAGRLICIDSEKDNVDALQRAVEQLRLGWIEPVHYAVSDAPATISGIDVKGHAYFWDPHIEREDASARLRPELKALWDEIYGTGKAVSQRAERLDTILTSLRAKPTFVNFTINGYEPTGIRGMGELLSQDVIVSFVARAPESYWENGFLEELEQLGFALVLSNLPHSHESYDAWFPYITAMRPHRLANCGLLIPGRFDVDGGLNTLVFYDRQDRRLY
jgi:hypothetical protein